MAFAVFESARAIRCLWWYEPG